MVKNGYMAKWFGSGFILTEKARLNKFRRE